MQTHDDATRALEQLDNVHVFEGMDVAMVLKWVDQDLQKRRKMEREPGYGGRYTVIFEESSGPYREQSLDADFRPVEDSVLQSFGMKTHSRSIRTLSPADVQAYIASQISIVSCIST